MEQMVGQPQRATSSKYGATLGAMPAHPSTAQVGISMVALASLVEASTRPLAVVSHAGECLVANRAAHRLLGTLRSVDPPQGGGSLGIISLSSLAGARALGLTARLPETHYLLFWEPIKPELAIQELARHWRLTRRQSQVLQFLLDGCCNKTMAQQLSCAVRTIELHVSAILEKSGCRTRGELIAKAWRELAG